MPRLSGRRGGGVVVFPHRRPVPPQPEVVGEFPVLLGSLRVRMPNREGGAMPHMVSMTLEADRG